MVSVDQEFRLGHSENGLSLLVCIFTDLYRSLAEDSKTEGLNEIAGSLTETRGYTSRVTHLHG